MKDSGPLALPQIPKSMLKEDDKQQDQMFGTGFNLFIYQNFLFFADTHLKGVWFFFL